MSKFDKIIGYSAVKKELKQIADTLKNREVYAKLGVSSPRGLLLYGEPGVGKSLMASAVIEQKYGIFDVGGERDLDQAFDRTKNLIVNTCISGFHLHCNGYEDTESLKSEQEKAVAAEVEKFYRKAKEIISLNFEFFEKIAAALAKKKLLSAVDIQKIKSECKIVPVAL